MGIDAAMGIDERLDRVVSGIFAVGERSVGSRGAAWVDWARVQRDCALTMTYKLAFSRPSLYCISGLVKGAVLLGPHSVYSDLGWRWDQLEPISVKPIIRRDGEQGLKQAWHHNTWILRRRAYC